MSGWLEILAWAGLGASLYMAGLIWRVQRRTYPRFRLVAAEDWSHFHQRHTARFGWLAGLPMIVELIGSLALMGLMWDRPVPLRIWAGFLLALAITTWLLTFVVAVPLHNRLARSHDRQVIEQLIRTNWARTLVWTLKALLVLPGFAWLGARG